VLPHCIDAIVLSSLIDLFVGTSWTLLNLSYLILSCLSSFS
jgi:hypothetical protein